jgi:hypothetical protein
VLSSQVQVARSLNIYLELLARRGENVAGDIDREMTFRSLLAHVPGDFLVTAILDALPRTPYPGILEFVSLLSNRVPNSLEGTVPADKWRPSAIQIRQLESALHDTFEQCRTNHDDVYIPFRNLAMRVAPTLFQPTIVEACRRQLDGWARYHQLISRWQQQPTSARPVNPIGGFYLNAACSFARGEVVAEFLALFDHPGALDVLPGAIAAVLNGRWNEDRKNPGRRGLEDDLSEGKRRWTIGRAFRQPSDELQEITDEAARKLSEKLDTVREEIQRTAPNPQQAQYRTRALLGILSNLPSIHVLRSVLLTLHAGLADRYTFPAVLRALLRQGWVFDDRNVINELEAVVMSLTDGTTWIQQNERYLVSEVCELIYCVESRDYLSRPTDFYREQWKRFTNDDDVLRRLGALGTDLSWEALLQPTNGQLSETYIKALANGLTPSRFARFLEFLRGVTIPHTWAIDGLANQISVVIAGDGSRLRSFIEACRTSLTVGKDHLALAVSLRDANAHEVAADYAIWMLESGRVATRSSPEYHLILELMAGRFGRHDEHRLLAAARNNLRRAIFDLAKSGRPCSTVCRRLLSEVEFTRREFGRPTDEPRHPNLQEPTAWTRVFYQGADNGN